MISSTATPWVGGGSSAISTSRYGATHRRGPLAGVDREVVGVHEPAAALGAPSAIASATRPR